MGLTRNDSAFSFFFFESNELYEPRMQEGLLAPICYFSTYFSLGWHNTVATVWGVWRSMARTQCRGWSGYHTARPSNPPLFTHPIIYFPPGWHNTVASVWGVWRSVARTECRGWSCHNTTGPGGLQGNIQMSWWYVWEFGNNPLHPKNHRMWVRNPWPTLQDIFGHFHIINLPSTIYQ